VVVRELFIYTLIGCSCYTVLMIKGKEGRKRGGERGMEEVGKRRKGERVKKMGGERKRVSPSVTVGPHCGLRRCSGISLLT